MVSILSPAIDEFADQVRVNGAGWTGQLNDLSREWLGGDLVGKEAGDRAAVVTQESLRGCPATFSGWLPRELGWCSM
jgi:hypothetical protein